MRVVVLALVASFGLDLVAPGLEEFAHLAGLFAMVGTGLVLAPAERVERAFPAAGTYAYVCAFHAQDMHGTVIVSSD